MKLLLHTGIHLETPNHAPLSPALQGFHLALPANEKKDFDQIYLHHEIRGELVQRTIALLDGVHHHVVTVAHHVHVH